MSTDEADALAAIDSLIDDFAHHRRDAYFAHFDPAATFVFYTSPTRLETRAEYEDLWRSWESDDDFRVVSCQSSHRRVQMVGDVAVFTHDVDTTVSMNGQTESTTERETIVMRHTDAGWTCVHEHLSGRD